MCRLIFCVVICCSFSLEGVAETEPASASALLEQMAARYAAMKAYVDTISVHFRNPDGAEGASAECKVWFSRPAFFRIDAESRRAPDAPPKREVIWSDGESARAWSTTAAVTLLPKIQLAGSKMFGTYAYHVPTLLERSYGGPQRLSDLTLANIVGEEEFEGVPCYRIRGEWLSDPYELWLGKNDLLVRKITADYKGYVMEEIHRGITVDQPIARKIFRFAPEEEFGSPASKKSE